MKKNILVIVLSGFLFSCAYNANIQMPQDMHHGVGKARYDLKSAVVITSQQKNEVVNMQVDIAQVSFPTYPTIYQIVQEKMKRVFATVDLLQESELVKEKYDVVIYTTPKFAMNRLVFEVSFYSTGVETKGGSELFRTTSHQKEAYRLPPGAAAGAVLTGATLFLASPITVPLSVKSIGEYSEKTITQMFGRALDESVDSLLANTVVKMYAEGGYQPTVQGTSASAKFSNKNEQLKTKPIQKSDLDSTTSIKGKHKKNAYAIVIGIENYRQKLPKADYADRDANTMTEYLTKVMGYPEENIVTLINDRAALGDFVKYFERWLSNNVEKDSTVFVYYSGHGAPNPKTGDAYLVPYDGDPMFIDQTGYPLKRLYDSLSKLKAKEVIIALDSCFSGAGGRSVLAKGARPLVMNLESVLITSPNMVVMSAASGDQMSSTFEERGHGLFTYFLLKGLRGEGDANEDGVIEVDELFNYIKPNVEKIARKSYNNEQTPQLFSAKGMKKINLFEKAGQ